MNESGPRKSQKKAWIMSTLLLLVALGMAGYSGLSRAGTPSSAGSPGVTSTASGDTVTATVPDTPSASAPAPGASDGGPASPSPSPARKATTASPSPAPTASRSPGGRTSPAPTANPSPFPPLPGDSPSPSTTPATAPSPVGRVTDGETATSLASDGSAANPTTTFYAATDHQIIAVLSLENFGPGTTIQYVHTHNGSYTPSSTFTLKTSLRHFYVQFAAPLGGTLPTGHFGLRFYVNGQLAWTMEYDVL